jgi:hypothetical protein
VKVKAKKLRVDEQHQRERSISVMYPDIQDDLDDKHCM